jgi:23S rRNA (cytosine1962-C5)-methyltransferase
MVPAEIRLSRSAARAVASGHPWVFREGPERFPVGAVLRLIGPDGRAVGFGLADDGPVAVRVLGRGEPEPLDRLLADRLGRADRCRWNLLPPDTDAYRLVNGAGDGLPGLIVDRYGSLAVVKVYSAAWVPHLDGVVAGLARLPWVETVLRRFGVGIVDGREGTELLRGPAPDDRLVVSEGGMKLLVRPYVGQKTGLFLDQREHRALVGRWASGRVVANLFSYTGGFSVAAALGGAARVISVDIAPEAIADAKETFRLNGLDPDDHGFEVADAFAWAPAETVTMWVVDPPSLARGKKDESAATAAYKKIHRRLAPLVPREGLFASSSCTARLTLDAWRAAVAEGLHTSGDWSWHWVSEEPPDHPVALAHDEARYLKFALLRRR